MRDQISVERLWKSVRPGNAGPIFNYDRYAHLPEAARRFLEHSIACDTRLAAAVRLRMHGEIKLKRWFPFVAQQVIRKDGEMIWRAAVRINGMPVWGYDRLSGGQGAMQWRLFGLFPLMSASGNDITRSVAGRIAAESVWLPSMLCGEDVSWTSTDACHAQARFFIRHHAVKLTLAVDCNGRIGSVKMLRWGNPGGGGFGHETFGGTVEEEGTFGGYTIPKRLRVGWYFGTDRFRTDGEFFRVTVDDAVYR